MAGKKTNVKVGSSAAQQCRRHPGELVTVFSSKYDRCMCLKCAMEQHDLLSDFMPISEGVELMKSVGMHLIDEITVLSETTKTLKQDRLKFIERVRTSDKTIKAEIRKVRDKINRHLDLLEQNIVNKLKHLVDKSDQAFLKDQHSIQTVDSDLKKLKENIAQTLKNKNATEMLAGVVEAKLLLHSKKVEIREQTEKMPTTTLKFIVSLGISEFIDNVSEFGEVSMQTQNFEFDENVEDVATEATSFRSSFTQNNANYNSSTPISFRSHDLQRSIPKGYPVIKHTNKYGMHSSNPYHHSNTLFGQTANGVASYPDKIVDDTNAVSINSEGIRDDPIVVSADHDGPCNLCGIAALTSGRIIVCDSKHKCMQMINRRSEILDTLVFHYKPANVATVSENSIVVSFVEKDFISVISASNQTLTHVKDISISGRGGSYSVAFCKDRFAVCRRGEIRIVSSEDGTLIRAIQIDYHFPQLAMSDGGSKIYLSDFVGGKVTCINDLGKTRWEYSQDELEPCSLAVDLNQLFVADVRGKILILSSYGVLMRELQCQGHLLSICVDPNTGTLLVTQEENKNKTKSRSIKLVAI